LQEYSIFIIREDEMKRPKIVFIGAGSMSFGIPTFRDLFTTPELKGATLGLVDINPENLKRMYELAVKMNNVTGMELEILQSAERRELLPGADYVVNSLAIERCELWKQDFCVPLKHGIRHCLGENGGPGALFFTLRTIPLILAICRDMEELCPGAWFLNFSNPESRIVLAVNKYTNIKCIGLCHGIYMARDDVASILGIPEDEIEVNAAGLNHFQWLTGIRRTAGGGDLYPELREKEKNFDAGFRPFTRKLFRAFGYWPTCSDDHLGEYLPYGYEAGMEGYDFDSDERDRAKMKQEVSDMVAGNTDIREWLKKSGEKAIEVITALHTGRRRYIPSAIVYNDGALKNMPADLAVEIPVEVDGNGIHKVFVGDLPPQTTALMSLQIGAQQMSVEAAVRGDKTTALQALLVDPVINDTEAAQKILDELWEINAPYIRPSVLTGVPSCNG
jgi:alpha-galactosidase